MKTCNTLSTGQTIDVKLNPNVVTLGVGVSTLIHLRRQTQPPGLLETVAHWAAFCGGAERAGFTKACAGGRRRRRQTGAGPMA